MLQPEILAKRIRANLVEQKEKLEDFSSSFFVI